MVAQRAKRPAAGGHGRPGARAADAWLPSDTVIWVSGMATRIRIVKTTIDISDHLLRRAKQAALERGTTLRAVIEEALQRALGPAVTEVGPLRTVTWGKAAGREHAISDAEVLEAVAREREAAGDADRWLQRFGFVPPGVARK